MSEVETKYCTECRQDLPITNFKERIDRGKKTIRSECEDCRPKVEKRRRGSGTWEHRMNTIAPINAVVKLLEERPELIAEIVRRDKPRFETLLEEERAHLTRLRDSHKHSNRTAKEIETTGRVYAKKQG